MLKNKEKTNKKIKKILLSVVSGILAILAIIGIIIYINYYKANNTSILQNYSSEKDTNIEMVSEELLKDKVFEEMQVKDISIKKEDGIVYFLANIENNTDKDFEGTDVKIKFINQDSVPIANFKIKIDSIKSKELGSIKLSTSMDIMDAYNFIIEN